MEIYWALLVWVICIFFNLYKIYQFRLDPNNLKINKNDSIYFFSIVLAPIITFINVFLVVFVKPWNHLSNFD